MKQGCLHWEVIQVNRFLKYALVGALSAVTILAAGCGGDKKGG